MSALMSRRSLGAETVEPLNIVVLDDDRFDRKRLSRWIQSASHGLANLTEAADLEQFTQAIADGQADVVFIDYRLADGNAADAMDILLQSAESSGAYAVMVSGVQEEEVEGVAETSGYDQFLEKSSISEDVIARVLAEARGKGAFQSGQPAEKPSSMIQFLATRGRRRQRGPSPTEAPAATSPVQTQPLEFVTRRETRPRLELVAEAGQRVGNNEISQVWDSDWPGSDAFFRDFLAADQFEFDMSAKPT